MRDKSKDRILIILNIKLCETDGEPILDLIGDYSGFRYRKQTKLSQALNEYDLQNLRNKIRDYQNLDPEIMERIKLILGDPL